MDQTEHHRLRRDGEAIADRNEPIHAPEPERRDGEAESQREGEEGERNGGQQGHGIASTKGRTHRIILLEATGQAQYFRGSRLSR